jgi:hypothetical protein
VTAHPRLTPNPGLKSGVAHPLGRNQIWPPPSPTPAKGGHCLRALLCHPLSILFALSTDFRTKVRFQYRKKTAVLSDAPSHYTNDDPVPIARLRICTSIKESKAICLLYDRWHTIVLVYW